MNKMQLNSFFDTLSLTGLAKNDLHLIYKTIIGYPSVVDAKIFGSRAKGNYKEGSDIDIAIYFESNIKAFERNAYLLKMHDELEESIPIPYFFDLVDFNKIENQALKEHIERVGLSLLL